MTVTRETEASRRSDEPSKDEPGLREGIEERPRLQVGKVLKAKPRDLLVRFMTGAVTSIGAGAVALVFGARTGGIFLAFPAILAASLTLVEQKEDGVDAREDARGAIVGGGAMGLFALVVALTVMQVSGALALLIGAAVWLVSAVAIYALLWWR
jgi:hypothetical protein